MTDRHEVRAREIVGVVMTQALAKPAPNSEDCLPFVMGVLAAVERDASERAAGLVENIDGIKSSGLIAAAIRALLDDDGKPEGFTHAPDCKDKNSCHKHGQCMYLGCSGSAGIAAERGAGDG